MVESELKGPCIAPLHGILPWFLKKGSFLAGVDMVVESGVTDNELAEVVANVGSVVESIKMDGVGCCETDNMRADFVFKAAAVAENINRGMRSDKEGDCCKTPKLSRLDKSKQDAKFNEDAIEVLTKMSKKSMSWNFIHPKLDVN